MARNNLCIECHGMFDDDEVDGLKCIYCAEGVDSGFDDEEDHSDGW